MQHEHSLWFYESNALYSTCPHRYYMYPCSALYPGILPSPFPAGYQKLVPLMKMEVLPWDAAGITSHFKLKKINSFNLTVCVAFLLMIWKCHTNSVYLFQEYSIWKLVLHHQAQGIGVNQGYAQLSHCVNLYVLKSLQSPHSIWMHLIANKWVVSWMPKPNVCCTEASFVRWILVLLAEEEPVYNYKYFAQQK